MKKFKSVTKKIKTYAKPQKHQPGIENKMEPRPQVYDPNYKGSGKLQNKVAIITGGDSGIGHAISILFAKEGADVVIVYQNEHEDAQRVQHEIEALDQSCLLIAGDVGKEKFCQRIVEKTIKKFKKIDVLINNAAEQHTQCTIENISAEQLLKTFTTNLFAYFYLIKAAIPHMKEGSAIVNTTSVTAYKGNESLIDYSATKGAIVALTRSLSLSLIKKGIRVNAVAPGPIWTPLIPASFSKDHIKKFGKNTPMERPGQPEEVAPSYVFLASDDSSYMSGQVLHPNGGIIVNG